MKQTLRYTASALMPTAVLIALLSAHQTAHAGGQTLAFYDPDANHQAITNITAWFNAYLEEAGLRLKFQPVQSREAFEKLLADPGTVFAIASSAFVEEQGAMLRPLLVPASGGDAYYRKQLMVKADLASSNLDGKNIAATVSSKDPKAASEAVLRRLRAAGVSVNNAIIIPVAKDIDALLALTFGQVQAALVTPSSVDVLKRINPAAAATFRMAFETQKILRAPLCEVSGRAANRERQAIMNAFARMRNSEPGRKAMNTMGIDVWIGFESNMLGKR